LTRIARRRWAGRWRSSGSTLAASSPGARGRSERAFGPLQDRLTRELALAAINEIAAASRWIAGTCLPRHNARFPTPPAPAESGFVRTDPATLRDALCVEEHRVAARNNTVLFARRALQLPPSPRRPHEVKAEVRVRHCPDDTLAICHGPNCPARYTAQAPLLPKPPTTAAA
jgi:hypothetical protein